MLEADFHGHSTRSSCGQCSVMEMCEAAFRKGMKGLTISDHAPGIGAAEGLALEAALCGFSTFGVRVPRYVCGVRLFKGVEANVLDDSGAVDVPLDLARRLEIVLLGVHPYTTYQSGSAGKNTDALLRALESHPYADVISHPYQRGFAVDLARVAPLARELGVAFEINESVLAWRRADESAVVDMIQMAVAEGVGLSLGSDAHYVDELGLDSNIVKALAKAGGAPRIVNRTLADAEAFVAERRQRREAMGGS